MHNRAWSWHYDAKILVYKLFGGLFAVLCRALVVCAAECTREAGGIVETATAGYIEDGKLGRLAQQQAGILHTDAEHILLGGNAGDGLYLAVELSAGNTHIRRQRLYGDIALRHALHDERHQLCQEEAVGLVQDLGRLLLGRCFLFAGFFEQALFLESFDDGLQGHFAHTHPAVHQYPYQAHKEQDGH